jgi:hypothetical protein
LAERCASIASAHLGHGDEVSQPVLDGER